MHNKRTVIYKKRPKKMCKMLSFLIFFVFLRLENLSLAEIRTLSLNIFGMGEYLYSIYWGVSCDF